MRTRKIKAQKISDGQTIVMKRPGSNGGSYFSYVVENVDFFEGRVRVIVDDDCGTIFFNFDEEILVAK